MDAEDSKSNTDSVLEGIKRNLLKQIVKFDQSNGDWQCVVQPIDESKCQDNFASNLYRAELINTSANKTVPVVVKVVMNGIQESALQTSVDLFRNEDALFQQVMPLITQYSGVHGTHLVNSLIPKCYYASHEKENLIVVLDNLSLKGYKLANFLLDYDHCKLTFEALGRFHALSYAMKHKHKDILQDQILVLFNEASHFAISNLKKYNKLFLRHTSIDPIDFIRKSKDAGLVAFREKHGAFLDKLVELFQDPVGLMRQLITPKEPLAVLCHGDYNRNNIMFQYDQQEKPCQIKLIDFQTVRYANPSVDLSFVIFFNMTPELRKAHLKDLLAHYQKNVVDTLERLTDERREHLETTYSVKAFQEDLKDHAVYGYVISAMFIHLMLATPEQMKYLREWMKSPNEEVEPTEEFLKYYVTVGGSDAMQRSVAILKDIAEMHCC